MGSELSTIGARVPMIEEGIAIMPQRETDNPTVERFVSLASEGLVPMFDEQKQLFCYRLKKTEQGMVREGLSERYTMMTLMGLHRFQKAGGSPRFETDRILAALLGNLNWIDNVGDLGVLLWMCGIVCPEKLPALESRLQLETALARFRDARRGLTMELAWFLTGLSYWAKAHPKQLPRLESLMSQTYNLLVRNQGARGFFGHLARSGSVAGLARGRVGSFADQVYPIYAFAQFARACGHEEAAERSLRCATGICEEQGPLGQWWWHYDSRGGRVADGYPVFSVHQHAMAPMTLFGLGEVVNQSFDPWIYKGLRWINSENELGYEMESSSPALIWRCIYRSRRSISRYIKASLGRYSDQIQQPNLVGLRVLFECRPYELGWLLYAFAGRSGRRVAHKTVVETQATRKN